MKEKRRDSKGRILHTGESQRTDGKYLYKKVVPPTAVTAGGTTQGIAYLAD